MPIYFTHIITYHAVNSLITSICAFLLICGILYNWKKLIHNKKQTSNHSHFRKRESGLYAYLFIVFFLLIVSYWAFSEFLKFNNKFLVGFNETGLCMWHSSRNAYESAYIFIPWDQMRSVERSSKLGHRFRRGWNKITVFFKQAQLFLIQDSSTYKTSDGTCQLLICGREMFTDNHCSINFDYWTWMPNCIENEINNERKKNWSQRRI